MMRVLPIHVEMLRALRDVDSAHESTIEHRMRGSQWLPVGGLQTLTKRGWVEVVKRGHQDVAWRITPTGRRILQQQTVTEILSVQERLSQ